MQLTYTALISNLKILIMFSLMFNEKKKRKLFEYRANVHN